MFITIWIAVERCYVTGFYQRLRKCVVRLVNPERTEKKPVKRKSWIGLPSEQISTEKGRFLNSKKSCSIQEWCFPDVSVKGIKKVAMNLQ